MANPAKQPGLEEGTNPKKKPDASADGSGSVNDSEVSGARAGAADSVAKVEGQAADSSDASTQSDTTGANGEHAGQVKLRRGVSKSVGSGALNAASHFDTSSAAERLDHASDVDRYAKNSELYDQAVENIAAEIKREATKGTEIADTGIFGDPSMGSVYSDESTTAIETLLGTGVLAPLSHPKQRKAGTFYFGSSKIGMSDGDALYSHINAQNELVRGHDGVKGVLQRESLLFNRLNENGRFTTTPSFVMPKRGKFLLLGFNPYAGTGSGLAQVGTVRRESSNGTQHNYPVEQATSDGLFKVVELTATLEDLKSVSHAVKEYAVANRTKMEIGFYERVAQALANAEKYILTPDEVNNWPEFTKGGRSTLRFANDIRGAAHNYNCYNDLVSYAEFMSKLEHSESIFAGLPFGSNSQQILSTMKFHLGQEGRSHARTHFQQVMRGDIGYTDSEGVNTGAIPGIARYAQTMTNPRYIRRPGQYLTRLKSIWSRLDSIVKSVQEGLLPKVVGSKIKVNLELIDSLVDGLAIGRFSDVSMTSADMVKFGGDFSFVLDFDPNDLVFRSESPYADAAGNSYFNWYPAMGYANVLTATSIENSQTVVYSILPNWMRVLLEGLNSEPFNDRIFLRNETNAEARNYFYNWATQSPTPYLPISLDTNEPHFFWFYFGECLLEYEDRVFGAENANCGYMRWIGAKDVFKVDELYSDSSAMKQFGSLSEAINRVLTNKDIYVDHNWNTPQDIPVLSAERIALLQEEPFDKIVAELKNPNQGNGNSFFDGIQVHRSIQFQPYRRDTYMRSTEGLEFYAETSGLSSGNQELVDDVLHWLNNEVTDFTQIVTEDSPDQSVVWLRSGEYRYSQLYIIDTGGVNVNLPIYIRRTLRRDTNALTGFPITGFEADSSLIGYDTNPSSLLYEKDNFLFGAHSHGFAVVRHDRGRIASTGADESGVNVPGMLHYRYDLLPVIHSTLNSATAINHSVPQVTLPYSSRRTGSYNTVFNGGNIVPGRVRAGNNEYLRLMRIPSLYGTKRIVARNVTKPIMQRQSDVNAWLWHESIQNRSAGALPSAILNATKLRDFYGIMYMPDIDGDVIDNVTIDRSAISDVRFYAQQTPITFDLLMTAADDDLHNLLVVGNFTLSYDMIKQGANVNVTIPVGLTDAITIREVKPNVIPAIMKAYDEAFMTHLDRMYYDIVSQYVTLPTNNVVNGYIYYNNIDSFLHPEVLTQSYFNDIRQYHTDQVFIFLNRDWYLYGADTPTFYNAFARI